MTRPHDDDPSSAPRDIPFHLGLAALVILLCAYSINSYLRWQEAKAENVAQQAKTQILYETGISPQELTARIKCYQARWR